LSLCSLCPRWLSFRTFNHRGHRVTQRKAPSRRAGFLRAYFFFVLLLRPELLLRELELDARVLRERLVRARVLLPREEVLRRGCPRRGFSPRGSSRRSSKLVCPLGHLGMLRPFCTRTSALHTWHLKVPVFHAFSPARAATFHLVNDLKLRCKQEDSGLLS
jgi:hypothetical protein